jgi:hypothetical protein
VNAEPTHECPGGCGRADVARDLFACSNCWFWLPRELRHRITNAYRSGDRRAHHEAMAEALTLFRGRDPEDARRRPGTTKVENGVTYSWGGSGWRMVPASELRARASRGPL